MTHNKLFKYIQHFVPPFLPTIFIISCILYLSLNSFSNIPDTPLFHIPYFDKIIHFCMYLGSTLVFYFDWTRYSIITKKQKSTKYTWILWLLPILFGGTMEIAQKYLTNTRSCDFFDFLSNTAGVISGFLLGIFFISPWIKRYSSLYK